MQVAVTDDEFIQQSSAETSSGAFRTDVATARTQQRGLFGRDLQMAGAEWIGDEKEAARAGMSNEGEIGSWDQFAANEKLFNVKYSENFEEMYAEE